MGIFAIRGGCPLNGSIRVQGSKNAALPILAASILANGETLLSDCPCLSDVDAALDILRYLGCRVERECGEVLVDSAGLCRCEIPDPLMRRMRSSVIFMGAMLARTGEADITMPGGCELGPRPVDLHLEAMRSLGAEVRQEEGTICCRANGLHGSRIVLPLPSVGATENAMLAASGAAGETTILNAAREPEIAALQQYLRLLGVSIRGAGTSVISVRGGLRPAPCRMTIPPDRIAASTYLAAAAATGGSVELLGAVPEDLTPVLNVLRQMGADIDVARDRIRLRAGKLRAPDLVVTRPWPGFPTDAQPPLMAACLRAEGVSAFVETLFENRYRHAEELCRMGARIRVKGRVATVSGTESLRGCVTKAFDLRGGAALVIAALSAEGESRILDVEHIERGYEDMPAALTALGAQVRREE